MIASVEQEIFEQVHIKDLEWCKQRLRQALQHALVDKLTCVAVFLSGVGRLKLFDLAARVSEHRFPKLQQLDRVEFNAHD